MKKYLLVYKDKNDFDKKLRSLKKYCPIAFKDLVFNKCKNFRVGPKNGKYALNLSTSLDFKNVFGQIKLIYSRIDNQIIFEDLEPSNFLLDAFSIELEVYKGMFYRDDKDKFKIDLWFKRKELGV